MRILQLITRDQLRGAEVFAAQLSDQMAARGHQVVLACLLGQGGALTTRPEVRRVGLGGRMDERSLVSWAVWRNLRRLVKEFDPDVIQANGSETLKYAALLRVVEKRRPVVYRNISVMSMWAGSGVKRRVVGTALRRMSHVASVTKVGEIDLTEGFGLRPRQVSVLPVGVIVPPDVPAREREAAREDVRRRVGLPADAPLVVHVGSFTPEKNHKELLEAFARVVAQVPGARLLLVGDGPLRPQVTEAVAQMGLSDAILLAGTLPDAARVIAAADVLALPSLREGLPGVILEAAAAGVPAVAYDVGGVAEVVVDDVTGLLVARGDVTALTRALVRILKDSALAGRLGETARSRVAAEYSLPHVTDRFEGLYSYLASSTSR